MNAMVFNNIPETMISPVFVNQLNMKVIDGLRCISCFCVVLFHVNYVYGGALLLRESTCLSSVACGIPYFSMYFFRITWHMTLFWIISGFLCEYQLHQLYCRNFALQQQQLQMKAKDSEKTFNQNNNDKDKIECLQASGQPSSSSLVPWRDLVAFLSNRLFRLYPLFIILPIGSYFQDKYYLDSDEHKYTFQNLLSTLLFVMNWNEDSPICASVGWTVQVDVHGYIALVVLFAGTYHCTYRNENTTPNNCSKINGCCKFKRRILFLVYAGSIVWVILRYRPLPAQRLSAIARASLKRYGVQGVDTASDGHLYHFKITGSVDGGLRTLYPHFNWDDSNVTQSLRSYRNNVVNNTYFASVWFNHGSAIFLGSLLYLNLMKRNGQPNHSGKKFVLFIVGMLITRGWHTTSGIFMYLLLDVLLTCKPISSITRAETCGGTKIGFWARCQCISDELSKMFHNTITCVVVRFLSHPFFKRMAPYTYAIYLFHMVVIVKRYEQSLPARIAAIVSYNNHERNDSTASANIIDDACIALKIAGYEYNIQFVLKETIVALVLSFGIAFVAHWMIERPVNSLRKQWFRSTPSAITKRQSISIPTISFSRIVGKELKKD